ncbi:major facilitator superfamily domain-containing protein [Kockovaella imperatae]|uniref:Major facilitator superfamily domain-containing protein n=1 Tax=Kockovaella imperatae TaxID=4999 RepID=A0A1Y1UPX0_9TREE|nr:major facilitator superfamily domain-containing protein [Kockovaella imperatae]ORX39554.1 major facilitator superfamily domain-containing protein [Kockovaella imperatae]
MSENEFDNSRLADSTSAAVNIPEFRTAGDDKILQDKGFDGAFLTISSVPRSTLPEYTLYKRRFIALAQLSLLNIIVSWCWLTFSASSTTTAQYFGTSESNVNWLSTGFLFAFVAASPATLWTLNRGPKPAMLTASVLLIVGVWIRYGAARLGQRDSSAFGLLVFGQVIIGLAQPFVLIAPTRFSHLWFSEKGRITATAVASLANPLGGALAQLIGPLILTDPSKTPQLVLYVAIITSAICSLTIWVPAAPPTPPSASSIIQSDPLTLTAVKTTLRNSSFHLLVWAFMVYVSAFNATSSLLNQILEPYGYTENEAGIDGAVLIAVGLVSSAIASPVIDRFPRLRLPVIKICVFLIGSMYLALIFVPATRTMAAPYAVSAIIGSASFIILPLALEMMVDACHPIGPELSSTIAWAVSQLGGGIFIVVMNALKAGPNASPPYTMRYALVFQAAIAWVVLPLPMMLGVPRFKIV